MEIKVIKLRLCLILIITNLLIIGSILPVVSAKNVNIDKIDAFEKGIPWQKFETLKKVTFVNFDKDSLIDDYAYLASLTGKHLKQ